MEEGDVRKDCNEVDGARTASDRACISECWRSVGMMGGVREYPKETHKCKQSNGLPNHQCRPSVISRINTCNTHWWWQIIQIPEQCMHLMLNRVGLLSRMCNNSRSIIQQ